MRDLPLEEGRFFDDRDLDRKARAVVLGDGIAQDLFPAGECGRPAGHRRHDQYERHRRDGQQRRRRRRGRGRAAIYLPITVVYQR